MNEEQIVIAPVPPMERKTPKFGVVALILSLVFSFTLFAGITVGIISGLETLSAFVLLIHAVLFVLPVGLAIGSIVQKGSARTLPIIALVISGIPVAIVATVVLCAMFSLACTLNSIDMADVQPASAVTEDAAPQQ